MTLINKSEVRRQIQSRVSMDEAFINALEDYVFDIIKKAENRALGNGRKTVYAYDL